jgi:tungstate transport system substrate-binding protein
MFTRIFVLIGLGLFLAWPNSIQAAENPSRELKVIFPVTCVSPGLANGLAKKFEAEYKIPVKVISLCTGDAVKFIRAHQGTGDADDIDAMMGHDQEQEEQLIKDGYAVNFRQVCYSDFVLVGPKEDPAKIKGMKDALEALKTIAKAKATFFSRGDSSGTHMLELRLWKMTKIKPEGDWYVQTKLGTSETLTLAAKKRAYFISQWASFTQMQETVDLVPLVEDTTKLFTNYDIMAMNPARFPNANYVTAMQFIGFLTSPDVQKYIAEFGIEKFHRQSFIPLAVKMNKQQKEKK